MKSVEVNEKTDAEKYFRPSKLPVLNDRTLNNEFLDTYYWKEPSEITLPKDLFETPEDKIINYFSVLREAANPEAIEGSEKAATYFAYYYGYVDIIKEDNQYRISDSEFYGEDYLIVFYQLTNDTDIEIAQYVKGDDGNWTLIKLDPNLCLDFFS